MLSIGGADHVSAEHLLMSSAKAWRGLRGGGCHATQRPRVAWMLHVSTFTSQTTPT